MATVKKIIGRVPVARGEYAQGTAYYRYNLVQYLGSTYMCESDGITTAPATKGEDGLITTNAGWSIWADGTMADYLNGRYNDVDAELSDIIRDFGQYEGVQEIALTVGTSGRYVNSDGQETANSSYAISAPVQLSPGNIYLFGSSSALGTDIAVFSRKVTRTYDKVINYVCTYDEQGRIVGATADYDAALVYTYAYDDEGNATITDKDGGVVTELPTTHEVTESFYDPVFRTNDSTMPEQGYYVFPCTSEMEVVISGRTADIGGKNLLGVRYGVVASIVTNFLGTPAASVISQAVAQLDARVYALEEGKPYLGNATAGSLDVTEITRYRYPLVLYGHGVPSAEVIPDNLPEGLPWDGVPVFIGQQYINLDASSEGLYYAIGYDAVSDWKQA